MVKQLVSRLLTDLLYENPTYLDVDHYVQDNGQLSTDRFKKTVVFLPTLLGKWPMVIMVRWRGGVRREADGGGHPRRPYGGDCPRIFQKEGQMGVSETGC